MKWKQRGIAERRTYSNLTFLLATEATSLPHLFHVRLVLHPDPPMLPIPKLPKAPPLAVLAGVMVSLVGLVTFPKEPLWV